MSDLAIDRERWSRLVGAALIAANDTTEPQPRLASQASIAQTDWVIPVGGRVAGYLFLAFGYACKAYGRAETIRQRNQLCDALKAAAEAVQALAGLEPPPASAPTQRLPYADD